MKKILISFGIFTIVIGGLLSCTNNVKEIEQHKIKVESYRKQKDLDYAIPDKTMLTDALMKDFKGLKYFPIDYNYQVTAILTKLESMPKIEIKTSTGKIANYVIYGKLNFDIGSKPYVLSVYQSERSLGSNRKEGVLFVPFTDKTSGVSTYGGGRYIVLDIPEGNSLNLDFNMAYNPFCVYNTDHSCPIPPAENNLDVEILSGEKMY